MTNPRGDNLLKFIKWLSTIILLILIAGGLFLFSKVHLASNGVTYQDRTFLSQASIKIDVPNSSAKITPLLAIISAIKTYGPPRLAYDERINVEYQLMTTSIGGHSLLKEPVYIVSFVSEKGYSVPNGRLKLGGSELTDGLTNSKVLVHEFNTVVDAYTFETLFGFQYR